MPNPDSLGLCGRNQTSPCKLIWHSQYDNKVGVYPYDLLPAKRTIWSSASDGGYSFTPPLVEPGQFGPAGFLFGLAGFGPGQSDVFTPNSNVSLSFIKSANRLNVTHVVTQQEIDDANSNEGVASIDIGEYILEVMAVTDLPAIVNQQIEDEDLADIEDSGEHPSDKLFRKLFDLGIPNDQNRLLSVDSDNISAEYRYDNGSVKANDAFHLPRLRVAAGGPGSDITNAIYVDTTSRRLKVDLHKITVDPDIPTTGGGFNRPTPPSYPPGSLQDTRRKPRAGDIIFLTYVAVVKHYMRQSINVAWTIQAADYPSPVCVGFPSSIKVVNYRFYEWNIKDDAWAATNQIYKRLGGWRAVESFNIKGNYSAVIGEFIDVADGSVRVPKEIGDIVMQGGQRVRYMKLSKESRDPSEIPSIRESDLREFINGTDSIAEGEYTVEMGGDFRGGKYHVNDGINGNKNIYKNTVWFTNFTESYLGLQETRAHVFYNVHPLALQKRDVDKIGIERFLAQAIESDIIAGRETSFPFMDDPYNNLPFATGSSAAGASESLSSSNTSFEPIQPVTGYTTANAEIFCGVGGSVRLGSGTFRDIGNADVIAEFSIKSNIITENFEEDTKVFVERNFTQGQVGKTYVSVQGSPGAGRGSVSCVSDSALFSAFAAHAGPDGFLMTNSFLSGYVSEGLSELDYRPDLAPEPIIPDDPPRLDIAHELDYNGILGDIPGFKPGQRVGVDYFADPDSFEYITTDVADVQSKHPSVPTSQISELIPNYTQDDKIIFPLNTGYYGRTEIEYEHFKQFPISAVLIFLVGSSPEEYIDSIFIDRTFGTKKTLIIDHRWMRGNSIELRGAGAHDMSVSKVTIIRLRDDKANDFLTGDDSVSALPGLTARSVLCKTRNVSTGSDRNSILFVFFDDELGGISCLRSSNNALWEFHYGIVERVNEYEARNPFVINANDINTCFLFFSFLNKIFCKPIDYALFNSKDSLIIEQFSDIFILGNPNTELLSKYSDDGRRMRRRLPSFSAAGDLADGVLLDIMGVDIVTGNMNDQTEKRFIEVTKSSGNTILVEEEVRKSGFSIGNRTAFAYRDIDDEFFSVCRTNTGVLKLFFMGTASNEAGGGKQLQCHFSGDDGMNWYDHWEFVDSGYDRLSLYADTERQFVDQSVPSTGNVSQPPHPTVRSVDQHSDDHHPFGINLHWSRLKRHKQDQTGTFDFMSESQVLEVESPYIYYNRQTSDIYFFYIYNRCLLCKVGSDKILDIAFPEFAGGMTEVKEVIEQSRSYFIDGDLSDPAIREEIHMYVNTTLSPPEQMIEGNIIFNHQYGIDNFNEERSISAQRVCAYELPNGGIRVFYKHY